MRTFPCTRPDPLEARIENLETSLRQISDIFAPLSIESFELDPEAKVYTDDEIIDKINAAVKKISRANSITKAARPIGICEITSVHLATGTAKENLDAMNPLERSYVNTNPDPGEYKVVSIQVKKERPAKETEVGSRS